MSDAYQEYKKQFKKPIRQIAELMPRDFTDDDFINKFKYILKQNSYDYIIMIVSFLLFCF